ncbi:MAG: MFS transporter [Lachnospiraceae bacterium]|nr:MFS transporter [Lachnospiraceae bacterium]
MKKDSKTELGKWTLGYFIVLFVMLTLVYIVDEIASNITTTMQPYVILDLFKIPGGSVLSDEYASAVGVFTAISMVSYVFMLIAPFYKALADKYGRKPFLILNTLIMGVGMLICMVAPNYIIYIIGVLVITFVRSNDMQVMYIIETAPDAHRAKLCNITKAIGLISVSLIGLFRQMFYNDADISSWRMVFLIPAILGIAVALICIPIIRETPVFLKKKRDKEAGVAEETSATDKDSTNIKTTDANDKKETKSRGGVKNAFIYIFKNPQVRKIMIAAIAFALVTGITSYYSTVLEASESGGFITDSMISMILVVFPFVNGVFTFICGFISDALGRKKACFVFSAIAMVGLIIFVLGTANGWNEYVIGIGWGMFIGTLWSITDTLVLVMPSEATPTDMRASVLGVMSLLLSAGMALSVIIFTVAMNVIGTAHLGIVALCICIPLTVVACILLTRVKETKGNDLNVG